MEGAERLIEYGFNQLNLHKIVAKVAAFNDSSIRIVEKIGFSEEGIQRQQDLVDGEYQDVHLYGLLKPDWKELNDGT